MRNLILAGCLVLPALCAHAADIGVVGLFPGKAVLVVDGGAPKTYAVGKSIAEGVKLISANETSATIEMNGKRQTITIGEHINRIVPGGQSTITLQADTRGHFIAHGQINGGTISMLVDTGATVIALPAADAVRLGIDYKKGEIAYMNTANGVVSAYRVKLNSVRIGTLELNQVDASVLEGGLSSALLGMSFLNRTEMRRDGHQMTLTKRF
ncbi:MAG: TIGR02281 family clan AA aspartic protease [Pseudomonadota bacterium]